MSTLTRRLVTIPVALAAMPLWFVLTPLVVPAIVVADLAVGRWRLPLGRLWLFVPVFLAHDWFGIFGGFAVWVSGGFGRRSRFVIESRMQGLWAGSLLTWADRLLGIRLDLGDDPMPDGPVIVLSRHASMADAIIPAYLFPEVLRRPVHYVLKRELIFDPAIDIIGSRLGNHFVTRGGNVERETAQIAEMARGAEPNAGLVIFPEGTYATARAKQRVAASLERRGDLAGAALNRELVHLLPPKAAGTLTLLDRCPDAEVVLLAHTGLEGVAELSGLWKNLPLRHPVIVRWWTIDRPEPGADTDRSIDWLHDRWRDIDRWVEKTNRENAQVDARCPPQSVL